MTFHNQRNVDSGLNNNDRWTKMGSFHPAFFFLPDDFLKEDCLEFLRNTSFFNRKDSRRLTCSSTSSSSENSSRSLPNALVLPELGGGSRVPILSTLDSQMLSGKIRHRPGNRSRVISSEFDEASDRRVGREKRMVVQVDSARVLALCPATPGEFIGCCLHLCFAGP